jgi:hypothetical protein
MRESLTARRAKRGSLVLCLVGLKAALSGSEFANSCLLSPEAIQHGEEEAAGEAPGPGDGRREAGQVIEERLKKEENKPVPKGRGRRIRRACSRLAAPQLSPSRCPDRTDPGRVVIEPVNE